jgi:hypothetical protein
MARGASLWALEVKSGRSGRLPGLQRFRSLYPEAQALVIGSDGIPLEEFLGGHPARFFDFPDSAPKR